MLQEVITYLVIILAVFFALWKIIKKLRNFPESKTPACRNGNSSIQFNCNECQSQCILRDKPGSLNKTGNNISKDQDQDFS